MPSNNTDLFPPEDATFPETLRITIQRPADAFDEAIANARSEDDGPAVVTFEDTEGFRRLLTDRRLELLESLMGESADSISALAERLDRNYATVHEDVEVLADHGVVKFRRRGQSKRPFVPYETIEFDVTVTGNPPSEDSEAPA